MTFIAKDLTADCAPKDLVDDIAERGIVIDIQVNNAGLVFVGASSDMSVADSSRMIASNTAALLHYLKNPVSSGAIRTDAPTLANGKLGPGDTIGAFDCGREALNRFLVRHCPCKAGSPAPGDAIERLLNNLA